MYKRRGKEQWFVKHKKRGQGKAVVWGSGIAPGSFVSVMGTCWARTMRKGLRHLPVVVAGIHATFVDPKWDVQFCKVCISSKSKSESTLLWPVIK